MKKADSCGKSDNKFRERHMASRGKKKTQARGAQPVQVQAVKEKKDNRWAYVLTVLAVLLVVLIFINSFTVRANIEYTDESGNNLLEGIDSSQLTFEKSALTVLFAPVDGYDGAVDFTLENLPLSKDSEIVQDIAKELVSSYPAEKLALLDQAYVTIYVTEVVYLAATLAFAAFTAVVALRRKKGDDVLALVGVGIMTVLSVARLVLALVMCMSSTKEFVITAAGAPWLSLVATVACTVLIAVFVYARIKGERAKAAEKVK